VIPIAALFRPVWRRDSIVWPGDVGEFRLCALAQAYISSLFNAVCCDSGWWLFTIKPSNERQWQPDLAKLPYATVDGDKVTVHDIRNVFIAVNLTFHRPITPKHSI